MVRAGGMTLVMALLAGPVAAAPTVVVAPLTTSSGGEYGWIGSALAASLTDRLVQGGQANVFSQKQWAAVLRERDIAAQSVRGDDDALVVARQLGADQAVVGAYTARWPDLHIQARRVAVADGKVIAEASADGHIEDLVALEAKLARGLYGADLKKAAKASAPSRNVYAWHHLARCREALTLQSLGATARLWIPAPVAAAARADCEAAQKLDKKARDVAALLALAAFAEGDKGAGPAIDRAIKKDPSSGLAEQIGFFIHAKSGEMDKAIALLDKAVKKRPGLLHARTTLGEAHLAAGRFDDAEKVFRASLLRTERQPWVWVQLSKVHAHRGEADAALAAVNKAVEMGGADPVLLMEKASRLIDAKKYKEAEATLRAVMQKDPRLAAAYVRLGYIYLETNQLTLAGPILLKALYEADRPSERRVRAYAHFDLAKLAARRGDKAEALRRVGLAVDAGFDDKGRYERDPDLKGFVDEAALRGKWRS